MNNIGINAQRLAHLRSITNYIEANAPEVATRSRGGDRYEGEEEFEVTYNNIIYTCIRRVAFLDTSNLDYYSGWGYSTEEIYDEIAVLKLTTAQQTKKMKLLSMSLTRYFVEIR